MIAGHLVGEKLDEIRGRIALTMPDNPALHGWAAYSQCDEDGIIRECLRRIATATDLSCTFVEIGCGDGLENNTHNLLLSGNRGVWIDGSPENINKIRSALGGGEFEALWIAQAHVSITNILSVARRAKKFLGVDSLDFLSLDIDGNDWHLLPTLIDELNPKLVCAEYNGKFPPPARMVMRYEATHTWGADDYFGASLQSLVLLLRAKNYSLVCCNLSGANAFFVRNDLFGAFTHYATEQLYQPTRYHLCSAQPGHRASLKWAHQHLTDNENQILRFVPAQVGSARANFAIHATIDQFVSGDIARDGVWEPFESEVLRRICQRGDVVLDLGANIGWYSVLAASLVGSEGKVFAFEPDRTNLRLLEINAAVHDECEVIKICPRAVSEIVGEKVLFKSPTNLGDHRLFSDGLHREESVVGVTTLDTFFADKTNTLPHVLKSDTQGSEARILRGARTLFAGGWRPVMLLEFWPFGLTNSGDDPLSLWREIVSLGYQTFEVSEANPKLIAITLGSLQARLVRDITPSSGGFINLLCIPEQSSRLSLISDLIEHADA